MSCWFPEHLIYHSLLFGLKGKRMNSVLIIGCGDIGLRVALQYRAGTVTGVVRSAASADRLAAAGVEALHIDLDADITGAQLPADGCEIYYFAPPPGTGDSDTRVAGVCAALAGDNRPEKLVYISTSAVYGDCNGDWIDETAPLRPGTARGRRRLDAEQQLLRWGREQGVPVVILRVPGIYAHDRLPVERLRKGLPVLAAEQAPYTNRIHADDLAHICIAAMQRGRGGEVFNVSDGHPTTMTDYFNRVADALGLARPPQVDRETAQQALSASMLSFLGESKRLHNAKMLEQLDVTLRYPDLSAGLAGLAGLARRPG
jgi:nucleoside-diphosphate-sugar epimerase